MPLFWLSLAFLVGIILSAHTHVPAYGWILAASIPFLLLIPSIYRRWTSLPNLSFDRFNQLLRIPGQRFYPLIATFIAVGAFWYQLNQPTINQAHIAYYNDQPVEYILQGVIVSPPDLRDTYSTLRVQVEQLREVGDSQDFHIQGLLLARVDQATPLRYGDRIRMQGKLETPPENEDFSYRDYLAHQSVYSIMSHPKVNLLQAGQGNRFFSGLYSLRERGVRLIYQLYPDPEASLVAGIVLGFETGISEQVQKAFRLTGTSHIIVISGFNISIIAQMFNFIFSKRLGKYKGAIVAVIGILLYTLLVGANAAVVRAAVLGIFALGGRLIGRRQTGLNSLTIAGAGMALFDPKVLWDVSFQLSFAATLGIMIYAEPFTQWFTRAAGKVLTQERAEKLAGPVGEYFLITLAAQLTTLPLLMYYFKRLSLTTLLANPLVLPAQPALMVLGGLSVLSGIFIKPLGQLFAWAAWPFAAYTIHVVEWLAKIPHGSIPLGQVALTFLVLFYLVLILLTYFRSHLTEYSSRLRPAYTLGTLSIVTFLVWKAALYAPDGLMHVTLLDVGTADAVLIQSPTGRYVLINGGPSTLRLSDALGRRLPPFHRSLDWLVVGDIDEEDVGGIPGNMERFLPKNVLWAGNSYANGASTRLWKELQSNSIPITQMQAGHVLDLGSGVSLQVLTASKRGATMLLEWENFRMLLPMGMDFVAQDSLMDNMAMRNISALVLAESGYAPLNPPEMISLLHPQLALLSVAPADPNGLPSSETLEALAGYNLMRTDLNGWIQITTDGKQMWVEAERK